MPRAFASSGRVEAGNPHPAHPTQFQTRILKSPTLKPKGRACATVVFCMVDIPYGSEAAGKFLSNVGLITSNGPNGEDIMAAEWTRPASHSPGLLAVNIGPSK